MHDLAQGVVGPPPSRASPSIGVMVEGTSALPSTAVSSATRAASDGATPSRVSRRITTSRITSPEVYWRCEPATWAEGPRPYRRDQVRSVAGATPESAGHGSDLQCRHQGVLVVGGDRLDRTSRTPHEPLLTASVCVPSLPRAIRARPRRGAPGAVLNNF